MFQPNCVYLVIQGGLSFEKARNAMVKFNNYYLDIIAELVKMKIGEVIKPHLLPALNGSIMKV